MHPFPFLNSLLPESQYAQWHPSLRDALRLSEKHFGVAVLTTRGMDHRGSPRFRKEGALCDDQYRRGLNTWAAFVGTQEDAETAGDVAMLESEITPVLKALRKNGLDVVAIHHHMTGDYPVVILRLYCGTTSS